MDLYIAEKNTLAETLCTFLSKGKPFKKSRYQYDGPGFVMTSCLGHTMELCDASQYDQRWQGPWSLETLPILPTEMQYRPIERQTDRLKAIIKLCNSATRIIHCGDPDREGQYLVDIVIQNSNYTGEVFRWWPDDLSSSGLEKSFRAIKSNKQYETLGIAAKYRAWADWIVGINYTRLYTLNARNSGHQDTVSIGRVQTPTFALVHNRCIEIETFTPVLHYGLTAVFTTKTNQSYKGKLVIPDSRVDEHGRCLDRGYVVSTVNQVSNQTGEITSVERSTKRTAAPLPYSLSALQEEAGKKWGYTLKEVLSGVQYLYEEMQVLTYPRTDCRYLSEGDFSSCRDRIDAISKTVALSEVESSLDYQTKPRCFNDRKTTAHTAIVPTTTVFDLTKYNALKESDRRSRGITSADLLSNIYEMCALRFAQQLLPAVEHAETEITTCVEDLEFRSKLRTLLNIGWKAIGYTSAAEPRANDNDESDEHSVDVQVAANDIVSVSDTAISDRKTTPPDYFTEGSLAVAMSNIANYVDDPEIKKRLKETDGIGTEATKTTIVERLKTIGVIATVNGNLISTTLGRILYPSIPPYFKSPTMTAVWEAALNGVAEGRVDHNAFHRNICAWTDKNISKLLENPPAITFPNLSKYKCPKCDGMVVSSKGKFGMYWRCVEAGCKSTYQDYKKQPLFPVAGHGDGCTECGDSPSPGTMLTKSTKGDLKKGVQPKIFLGCSNYPDCKHSLWDIDL